MRHIQRIIRHRLLQHTVFWVLVFYVLLKNFKTSSVVIPIDLLYTSIFIVYLAAAVYINLALLRRFFHRGKYVLYSALVIALLGGITWVYIHLFDVIVEVLFKGYYLISYFDYWDTLKYFVILVGISSLLHFSKSWFLYKESQARLVALQKEKVEAELNGLKSQINPHFLFNSLNSIYSMVLHQSPVAPEALIRLSDSMRYMIYESNKEKVPLASELDFIRNYLALQQLRMSAKDRMNFTVDGEADGMEIAPLLLIPIIENSFKHGIKGETAEAFVTIHIVITNDSLHMTVENNVGHVDEVEHGKQGGAGLATLEKRLELIYPDRYSLQIQRTVDTFKVALNIKL